MEIVLGQYARARHYYRELSFAGNADAEYMLLIRRAETISVIVVRVNYMSMQVQAAQTFQDGQLIKL
jgi:hypothetical protein